MASQDEVTTSLWTESSIPSSDTDPLSDIFDLPLVYIVLRVSAELLSVVITIIGNVVTIIAVVKYRNLKTITNNFVISLSLADLLIVPSRTYYCYLHFTDDWFMWKLGIFLMILPLMMSQGISLYTLLLIAVDRYIAVNHAASYKTMLTRKRSLVIIVLVWFIIMFENIFVWTYFGLQADVAIFKEKRLPEAVPPAINNFVVAPAILLALGLTIFLYVRIFGAMRKQKARVGQITAATNDKTKKVTQLMATILGVLLFCWLPYTIFSTTYGPIGPGSPQYIRYVENFCAFLLYTNSCINPFLYAMKSPEFRKAYKKMFRSCVSNSDVDEPKLPGTSVTQQTNAPR